MFTVSNWLSAAIEYTESYNKLLNPNESQRNKGYQILTRLNTWTAATPPSWGLLLVLRRNNYIVEFCMLNALQSRLKIRVLDIFQESWCKIISQYKIIQNYLFWNHGEIRSIILCRSLVSVLIDNKKALLPRVTSVRHTWIYNFLEKQTSPTCYSWVVREHNKDGRFTK